MRPARPPRAARPAATGNRAASRLMSPKTSAASPPAACAGRRHMRPWGAIMSALEVEKTGTCHLSCPGPADRSQGRRARDRPEGHRFSERADRKTGKPADNRGDCRPKLLGRKVRLKVQAVGEEMRKQPAGQTKAEQARRTKKKARENRIRWCRMRSGFSGARSWSRTMAPRIAVSDEHEREQHI